MKKLSLIFAIAFLALLSCKQETPLSCRINNLKKPVVVYKINHYTNSSGVLSIVLKDSSGNLHDFYHRTIEFDALFYDVKVGDTLR